MRAGKNRHRLVFQAATPTQSASGSVTEIWADWRTVWGEVLPERGAKALEAGQIASAQRVIVRVRYAEGFRVGQRIRWRREPGAVQTLEVLSIVPVVGRTRDLEIVCQARESDGFRGAK